MDVTAVLIVAVAIFVWGAVAARFARVPLVAPTVFVAVGTPPATGRLVDARKAQETLRPLVEITFVRVLYPAIALISVHALGPYLGRCLRLGGGGRCGARRTGVDPATGTTRECARRPLTPGTPGKPAGPS
ncbi:hypothetical protein AB0F91_46495 [Amycolatopsis sp. NPDC023774]|uniref:hypothetical protein n=1 Tax=Amycolatopsis sp. NPDC023774 TaxID=3155015 RepID=UPI0033E6E11D